MSNPDPKVIYLTSLLLNAMQTKIWIESTQDAAHMTGSVKYKFNNYLAQTNHFIDFCSKLANFDAEAIAELEELSAQMGEQQFEGVMEMFKQDK